LKKALAYFVAAVFLGILLTIVPLITLAEINPTNNRPMSFNVLSKMRELESYSNLKSQENMSDEVTVLAISFIIASVGYMTLKRKIPHYKHQWGRPY